MHRRFIALIPTAAGTDAALRPRFAARVRDIDGLEIAFEDVRVSVATFQNDLSQRRVHVLIYNQQTSDDLSRRLLNIAKQAKVPVVGVSETEPADHTYHEWIMQQLTALDQALASNK